IAPFLQSLRVFKKLLLMCVTKSNRVCAETCSAKLSFTTSNHSFLHCRVALRLNVITLRMSNHLAASVSSPPLVKNKNCLRKKGLNFNKFILVAPCQKKKELRRDCP
uniref:Uncharacterized protein n=1 Tax=Anabas testudineus TaxID=64144 RepID=A0A7N6BHW7_ANATE